MTQARKFDEKIENLALELSAVDEAISQAEDLLAKKKEEYDAKTKELADLMEAEGFAAGSKITLTNGRVLAVKEYFNASIPSESKISKERDPFVQKELVEKRDDCLKWLTDNGLEDIIKSKLTAQFNKGEGEKVKEIMLYLQEKGVLCQSEEAVHPSTLKAALKEVMKAGQELPFELFEVSNGISVEIK